MASAAPESEFEPAPGTPFKMFVGGPLDGQRIPVEDGVETFQHSRVVVHEYDRHEGEFIYSGAEEQ